MKRKVWGTGALLLSSMLALAGCGGGGDNVNAAFEVSFLARLAKLKANTADKPHTVKLDNTVNISVKMDYIAQALASEGKYVILDLSACAAKNNTVSRFPASEYIKGIVLPDSLTAIGDDVFDKHTALVSISIGKAVASIAGEKAENAFDGCTNLTAITVAGGNPAYSSKDGVLFTKDGTVLLYYPEGRKGAYSLPPSVTSIAYCAFEGAGGLSEITIPPSLAAIGEKAFYGCEGLTSIALPAQLTAVEEGTFYGCKGLTSIAIPPSVTAIGKQAFYECAGLSSIIIPSKVSAIGEQAFTHVTSVSFEAGSAITGDNFHNSAFAAVSGRYFSQSDLKSKYLADGGGAGTYTRESSESRVWTKQ